MEVLEALEIQNTLSNLELRLDSLEIDIARQQGSREDDSRRVAGEMAVMRARVEDALVAFAGTADELREGMRTIEKRLADQHSASPSGDFSAQLSAGIDGAMAGVGDVLQTFASDVRTRVDSMSAQMAEVAATMASVAETVGAMAPLASRIAKLEHMVAGLARTD